MVLVNFPPRDCEPLNHVHWNKFTVPDMSYLLWSWLYIQLRKTYSFFHNSYDTSSSLATCCLEGKNCSILRPQLGKIFGVFSPPGVLQNMTFWHIELHTSGRKQAVLYQVNFITFSNQSLCCFLFYRKYCMKLQIWLLLVGEF